MLPRWRLCVVGILGAWSVLVTFVSQKRWPQERTQKGVSLEKRFEGLRRRYRFLFHKYHKVKPRPAIEYKVVRPLKNRKKKNIVAHLHSMELGEFEKVYGPYAETIRRYCDVVVTFSSDGRREKAHFPVGNDDALLEIENRGMDVGAKFVAVDYVVSLGVVTHETWMLFLHSKSDATERHRFFEWFVRQLPFLATAPPSTRVVGGVFNPYLIAEQPGWKRNELYMRDLVAFWDLEDDYFTFPVGNCFLLSLEVAKSLYSDPLLYYVLNTPDSLDVGWVVEYYKLNSAENLEDQLSALQDNIFVNNLDLGTGHAGHADSMVEHAFERAIFLVLRSLGRVGRFDVATTPLVTLEGDAEAVRGDRRCRLWSEARPKLVDEPLTEQVFETKTSGSKRTRVAVLAIHAESEAKMSATVNNLFYLAEIAATIVVVDSSPHGRDFRAYLARREDARDFFIVDGTLTPLQCKFYGYHVDLRPLPPEDLCNHYRDYGAKEGRYVGPFVLARVNVVKADNSDYMCHHKWLIGLGALKRLFQGGSQPYTDYILANDSILFVRSLKNWAQTFRPDNDLSAFVASNQATYHYPDFLRRYNPRGADIIRAFYRTHVDLSKPIDYVTLVQRFEIASSFIFDNVTVFHEAQYEPVNIHFIHPYVRHWLDAGYEVLKLKFLAHVPYPEALLLSPIVPSDFDPSEYKALNSDLRHLNDDQLRDHFRVHGITEGRIYAAKQAGLYVPDFAKHLASVRPNGELSTTLRPALPAISEERRKEKKATPPLMRLRKNGYMNSK